MTVKMVVVDQTTPPYRRTHRRQCYSHRHRRILPGKVRIAVPEREVPQAVL